MSLPVQWQQVNFTNSLAETNTISYYLHRALKRRAAVVEAKWIQNENHLARECDSALRQIGEKPYARKLEHAGFRKVIRLGIAFYRKQCLVKKA